MMLMQAGQLGRQKLRHSVLILNGEGANNATTFDDASLYRRSVTAIGNAKISTARSYLGSSSIVLDGAGDGIQIADVHALRAWRGDFSIRFALYCASLSGYITLFKKGYNQPGAMILQTGNGNGKINLYSGPTPTLICSDTGSAMSAGNWYFYEIERTNLVTKIWRDGTQVASAGDSSDYSNAYDIFFGGGSPTGFDNYFLNGNLANIEIVIGPHDAGRVPTALLSDL